MTKLREKVATLLRSGNIAEAIATCKCNITLLQNIADNNRADSSLAKNALVAVLSILDSLPKKEMNKILLSFVPTESLCSVYIEKAVKAAKTDPEFLDLLVEKFAGYDPSAWGYYIKAAAAIIVEHGSFSEFERVLNRLPQPLLIGQIPTFATKISGFINLVWPVIVKAGKEQEYAKKIVEFELCGPDFTRPTEDTISDEIRAGHVIVGKYRYFNMERIKEFAVQEIIRILSQPNLPLMQQICNALDILDSLATKEHSKVLTDTLLVLFRKDFSGFESYRNNIISLIFQFANDEDLERALKDTLFRENVNLIRGDSAYFLNGGYPSIKELKAHIAIMARIPDFIDRWNFIKTVLYGLTSVTNRHSHHDYVVGLGKFGLATGIEEVKQKFLELFKYDARQNFILVFSLYCNEALEESIKILKNKKSNYPTEEATQIKNACLVLKRLKELGKDISAAIPHLVALTSLGLPDVTTFLKNPYVVQQYAADLLDELAPVAIISDLIGFKLNPSVSAPSGNLNLTGLRSGLNWYMREIAKVADGDTVNRVRVEVAKFYVACATAEKDKLKTTKIDIKGITLPQPAKDRPIFREVRRALA